MHREHLQKLHIHAAKLLALLGNFKLPIIFAPQARPHHSQN
jgi:hypothetical protein